MQKIFIVRHGQDEDNAHHILNGRRDRPLTPLGRDQAKATTNKLKVHVIDVIYSSPLQRAYETAKIIASELGIRDITVSNDLIERDFGILTGKLLSDISKYATNILHTDRVDYFLEAEDAEDFPTLFNRGEKILKDLQNKHPDENILIVAHGDIGKMIRAAYNGWSWEEGLQSPYFDNTGIIELHPEKDVLE